MPLESNKTKISLRLFDGDLERLRALYPSLPYNAVIRQLVKTHLDRVEAGRRATSSLSALPEPDSADTTAATAAFNQETKQ